MNINKNINHEFNFYIHVHATKYFLITIALLLKKKKKLLSECLYKSNVIDRFFLL